MKVKNWYQSKTIWGVILAALGYFITTKLGVEGVDIPANADFEQLKQYADQVKEAKNNWPSLLGTLITASGYIMAVVGRIKADTEIKLGGIKPIKPTE